MLNPGSILQNRYQIIQCIGGGGMGDVYLAGDLRLANKRVVIKENRGGDPQLFYAEAAILATLRHPNLPYVTDHWIESATGAQYLVMSYVEGQTLEQIVQTRGGLPEADALAWMNQIFDAVKYLHANQIIHRDIKPQNIIITPDGRAVLVDFGIAKVMAAGHTTQPGARGFGSPGYAPLEQYTGGTDERSDVYALGATLFFALTGLEPPAAPDRANGAPLPSVRAANSTVSAATERAITQAMILVRNQRLQSIAMLEQVLQGASAGQGVAIPWLYAGVGVGAIVLLIAILGAIAVVSAITQPTPTRIAFATPTVPVAPTVRPTDTLAPRPTVAATVTPSAAIATATVAPKPTAPATLPPTPAPPLGETRVIGGAPMVFVPASEFTMGSNSGAASEQPAHKVSLGGFWIDKHEVSVKLYQSCAGVGCPATPPGPNWKTNYFGDFQNVNNPVINVTWTEANAYCAAMGKRLPTEAEWEFAARGNDGRLYPWGNTWKPECAQYGWTPIKGHYQTYADVDGYAICPSPAGALNMAGNVWEWVADYFDQNYYKDAPRENPKGPTSGRERIIRGGSVLEQPVDLRTTIRIPLGADTRRDNVGFRCAQ